MVSNGTITRFWFSNGFGSIMMMKLARMNKQEESIKNNPLFPTLSTKNPNPGVIAAAERYMIVKNCPAVVDVIPNKVPCKSFAFAVKAKYAP